MISVKAVLLFAALLPWACSEAQTLKRGAVYRYTAANGTVHYTNKKPAPGVTASKLVFNYVETSYPGSWRLLGTYQDASEILVNEAGIRRNGAIVSLWVMTNYPKVTVMPGYPTALRSFVQLWRVRCDEAQTALADRVGYTEAYGQGEVVGQWRVYEQWTNTIPGTLADQVTNVACPVAEPSAGPSKPVVPAQFQGEWNSALADCGTDRNDSRLRIYPGSVQFYESKGPVKAIVPSGDRDMTVIVGLTGEGQSWDQPFKFELDKTRRTLTDVSSDSPFKRYRCPPN